MPVVAYIDYTNPANDAAIALIETDAGVGVNVTYRQPTLFSAPDADPLERIVYALDANTAIIAMCAAVGVTAESIDGMT